jgi:hypothetical protein
VLRIKGVAPPFFLVDIRLMDVKLNEVGKFYIV